MSHMSFRLVLNSVTLDDLERRNSPNDRLFLPNSVDAKKFNFINSGPADIIRTVYYIHGLELMKLNFCRFIRVMNDRPYTLL